MQTISSSRGGSYVALMTSTYYGIMRNRRVRDEVDTRGQMDPDIIKYDSARSARHHGLRLSDKDHRGGRCQIRWYDQPSRPATHRNSHSSPIIVAIESRHTRVVLSKQLLASMWS